MRFEQREPQRGIDAVRVGAVPLLALVAASEMDRCLCIKQKEKYDVHEHLCDFPPMCISFLTNWSHYTDYTII